LVKAVIPTNIVEPAEADEEGNIVEPVKTARPPPSTAKTTPARARIDTKPAPEAPEVSTDKEDESDGDESRDNHEDAAGQDVEGSADEAGEGGEAESEAEQTVDVPEVVEPPAAQEASPQPKPVSTPTSILKKGSAAMPPSPSSAKGLSIKIPPATPGGLKVHPLKALYKRPQQDGDPIPSGTAPEPVPLSFFGKGDADDDTSTHTVQIPLTPFSCQDFESRSIRSAAPTPDTAYPSRMANFRSHTLVRMISRRRKKRMTRTRLAPIW
jgi:hypothetical protein